MQSGANLHISKKTEYLQGNRVPTEFIIIFRKIMNFIMTFLRLEPKQSDSVKEYLRIK